MYAYIFFSKHSTYLKIIFSRIFVKTIRNLFFHGKILCAKFIIPPMLPSTLELLISKGLVIPKLPKGKLKDYQKLFSTQPLGIFHTYFCSPKELTAGSKDTFWICGPDGHSGIKC